MTHEEAQRVADWCNTHEGGVPQPRAEVIPQGSGFWVAIKSLSLVTSGSKRWTQVETDIAIDLRHAARILGY